jgi:hypothetical protein
MPADMADRRSFGSTGTLQTAVGELSVTALIVGAGHATLDASLLPFAKPPPPDPELREALLAGRRPEDLLARYRARNRDYRAAITFSDISITDDRGVSYALRVRSTGGPLSSMIEQTHSPVDVVFGLEPLPGDGHAWYELRSVTGDSMRLPGATRAAARPGTAVSRAGRGNSGMPPGHDAQQPGDGARSNDGPPLQLDIATALPAVDGTAVKADTLISQPGRWLVYLRARPAWVQWSSDGRRGRPVMRVRAEDDRGGSYLAGPGSDRYVYTSFPREEDDAEVILGFTPRLDPLARALTLTFEGPSEQVTLEVAWG